MSLLAHIDTRLPALPRLGESAPETWLTGYLDCDGVVDALAAGALSGIDQADAVWTMVAILEPSGGATYWGSTRTAAVVTQAFPYAKTGPSWINHARLSGAFGTKQGGEITVTAPTSPALVAVAITVDRTVADPRMRGQIVSVDNAAASNTATGAETTFSADVILASYNGIAPFQGKIWGWFIALGLPTVSQLRDSLTVPPWVTWDAATELVGAWSPAGIYDSAGSVYIPDVAEAHGGYRTAVPALVRNGDLASVVIP